MVSRVSQFQPKEWLREALGEPSHSPLAVDDYELKQALRQIRLQVSQETDPSKRAALIESFRAQTVLDKDFTRLVGDKPAKAFEKLLGTEDAALLYSPGGALDKKSGIREALLDVLAGVSSDQYPTYAAKDLVAMVGSKEKDLALQQLEATLAQLPAAVKRLPKSEGNRLVEGTRDNSTEAGFRSVLQLAIARIRQPKAAAALDELLTPKGATFTYATHADTGVSQADFKSLMRLASDAIKSGATGAAGDIFALWSETKQLVGRAADFHDPQRGFSKFEYSGDPVGPSFQNDVKTFEALLQKHMSFKAGTQRPA